MVFLYHAYKIQQPGTVTRIVSGCTKRQEQEQVEFWQRYIQPLGPLRQRQQRLLQSSSRRPQPLDYYTNQFYIHFTPDYSLLQRSKNVPYKYMNKPYGLRHWMEHYLFNSTATRATATSSSSSSSSSSLPRLKLQDNDIGILMDPDMILWRPLTHDFTDVENHLWAEQQQPLSTTGRRRGGGGGGGRNDSTTTTTARRAAVPAPLKRQYVRHGHPMAQQDGYLNNQWMQLDTHHIFNGTTHVPQPRLPPPHEGPLYWNAGPPYLATVRDMYQIVLKWTKLTPRVVQVHPELFAEMYGFIYATVQLQLPMTLIKSLVVSSTESVNREGWDFIDDLPNEQVCHDWSHHHDGDTSPTSTTMTRKFPIALHYCKRYMYGPLFFSKYRIKKNIMDCDKPLLQPPSHPEQLVGAYDYTIRPPLADLSDRDTYRPIQQQRQVYNSNLQWAKREAFMICAMTRAMNQALTHHKQMACPNGTANLNETYTVYNDPTSY
ncbi:hypothetical protein ACA910_013586 [Epithemia clementina (nom. ined.)]